jgi:hypothetical protein
VLAACVRSFEYGDFHWVEDLAALRNTVRRKLDTMESLRPRARHARERVNGLSRAERVVVTREVVGVVERASFYTDLSRDKEEADYCTERASRGVSDAVLVYRSLGVIVARNSRREHAFEEEMVDMISELATEVVESPARRW